VKLDTGNRNFFGLVASASTAYLALGAALCCGLIALLVYKIEHGGVGAVEAGALPGLVALVLVAAGILLGVRSLFGQLRSSRRLSSRVRDLRVPAAPEVVEAASRAGLADRVVVVDSEERFSFAFGALTPRVAVSRGLVEAVSPSELLAVLEHERYHVRNVDPFKVMLARALGDALFYLPVLRDLGDRYLAGRELAADRRAVSAWGLPPLAGALLKVVKAPAGWREVETAAALGGAEVLDLRLAQLEAGREPELGGYSPRLFALSFAAILLVGAAIATSIAALGGRDALAAAMPGVPLSFPGVLLMAACAIPWVAAGVGFYAWLARRARAQPHTSPTPL
jgi:beta-lactamase regulating signal transducer with metallopeptidase domain